MSEIRKPAPREIIPEARSERVKLSLTKEGIRPSLLLSSTTDTIFPFFPSFSLFSFREAKKFRLARDPPLPFLDRGGVSPAKYRNIARATPTIFNFTRLPLVNTNGKEMEPPASFPLSASRLLLSTRRPILLHFSLATMKYSWKYSTNYIENTQTFAERERERSAAMISPIGKWRKVGNWLLASRGKSAARGPAADRSIDPRMIVPPGGWGRGQASIVMRHEFTFPLPRAWNEHYKMNGPRVCNQRHARLYVTV